MEDELPVGPNGEKRPADVVGNAVMVGRIATQQIEEKLPGNTRRGGLVGGKARASSLTPERRSEIARNAARARWSKR